jgi:hypothetical protein
MSALFVHWQICSCYRVTFLVVVSEYECLLGARPHLSQFLLTLFVRMELSEVSILSELSNRGGQASGSEAYHISRRIQTCPVR